MPALNDIFEGTVRDISSDGTGVVEHTNGQVFMVPGVWRGERGKFRVTGFKKRTGFAELVELVQSSPDRTAPACIHHGFTNHHCGGCPWQFVSLPAQLREKERRVRRVMGHLGVEDCVKTIWASPKSLGYRNRAQLKSDGRKLGYMSAKSNRLAAIKDCPVLTDKNRETLRKLLASLPDANLRPRKNHNWVTIDIDEEVTVETININRRRPFRQANSDQNERMRSWLSEHLEMVDRSGVALELFAGSGNFTEVIAATGFSKVVAVEAVEDAVRALRGQDLPRVEVEVIDLFDDVMVQRLAVKHSRVETLILDPPRDGFKAIGTLLAKLPKVCEIFYISCNLSTFARDLQVLLERGYSAAEIQPLDQCPHTSHVEILAHVTINGG